MTLEEQTNKRMEAIVKEEEILTTLCTTSELERNLLLALIAFFERRAGERTPREFRIIKEGIQRWKAQSV